MINTDNYIRYTRVDTVLETPTGVLGSPAAPQMRFGPGAYSHDRYRSQYAR